MISKIFNVIFGFAAIALSIRFEVGIFNYLFNLNYLILSTFGINVILKEIRDLVDISTPYLLITLSGLSLFNKLTILTHNKTILIALVRILFTMLIFITFETLIDVQLYVNVLVSVNILTMFIIGVIHRDKFKFGTIHPRYLFTIIILYTLAAIELFVVESQIHFYYFLLPLAFMYDFQLNLYYNSIRLGYSTFMRSGTFSRLLLIIDYYEIPETKV